VISALGRPSPGVPTLGAMKEPTSNTRLAVEFLTLWLERDRAAAAEHIAHVLNDPEEPDAASIIAGLLNLNMLTLLQLAKAQGAKTDEELYDRAGEILRDLAPHLPE
jgi:hypothetical protein